MQEPGRAAFCRGLAGPQPRALPASLPWGTGLNPGWRGGRSLGERGSGRGCRPVSRRALNLTVAGALAAPRTWEVGKGELRGQT